LISLPFPPALEPSDRAHRGQGWPPRRMGPRAWSSMVLPQTFSKGNLCRFPGSKQARLRKLAGQPTGTRAGKPKAQTIAWNSGQHYRVILRRGIFYQTV